MHVAAMKPVALSSADVPAKLIETERSVATQKAAEDAEKAKAEGKTVQSPEIVAKRIEGSVEKYLKEVSLFNQAFVKNDKQTVEQMLKARHTRSRALPCTWWAKASRRRSTTSPPKWRRRWPLPSSQAERACLRGTFGASTRVPI